MTMVTRIADGLGYLTTFQVCHLLNFEIEEVGV